MRMSAVLIALVGLALVGACNREEPTPTKVTDQQAFGEQPPQKRERKGPFSDPNVDPPPPRSEPQLGPDELEATLADAVSKVAEDRLSEAMIALRTCANKVPASARCDGALGMLLLERKLQKAHARYYVAEAAKTDDPDADIAFYRRLAKTAQRFGRAAEASDAMKIAIGRPGATAEDWAFYGEVLQHDQAKIDRAIEALAKAYEMAPDQHKWLRDQAVLVGQTSETARAIELFERYKQVMRAVPHEVQMADARIAELKSGKLAPTVKKPEAAPQ